MLQIERIQGRKSKKKSYHIIAQGNGKMRSVVATVDSIEKAACVLRFMSGSTIKGDEYQLAVETLREIDEAEGVYDEILSGKIDLRVPD